MSYKNVKNIQQKYNYFIFFRKRWKILTGETRMTSAENKNELAFIAMNSITHIRENKTSEISAKNSWESGKPKWDYNAVTVQYFVF